MTLRNVRVWRKASGWWRRMTLAEEGPRGLVPLIHGFSPPLGLGHGLPEGALEGEDVLLGVWEEVQLPADLRAGIKDSGMVPIPQETPDVGECASGLLTQEVHSHLASEGELAVSALTSEKLSAEAEVVADGAQDGIRVECGGGWRRRHVSEGLGRRLESDRKLADPGVGDYAHQASL